MPSRSIGGERAAGLVPGGADDGALSRRETAGLDHQRLGMTVHVGEGRLDSAAVKVRSWRAGTPAASITSLANALEASICAAAAEGPKTSLRLAQPVAEPAGQRRFGPDDDEIHV